MSIQKYDMEAKIDGDGEALCFAEKAPRGDWVYYDDHAAAIAAKDAEIARLKDYLENGNCIHCGEPVSDLDVDHWRKCPKHPANAEISALREEIKNLNHLLDKARVLRGDAAEAFIDRMEAVDRGDIPKSNKQPEIDYARLRAIVAEKKKQRG